MAALDRKVAWISGGGSGIGEAAAMALAGAGATVILTGRRRRPLEEVAHRVKTKGGTALVEAGDVTDANRVNAIASVIRERLMRLDIVVNNAGLNLKERHWADLTPHLIDTILQSNLTSAFYVVAAALPIMREQRDGVFIHTASWAGRFVSQIPGPGYSAAKHGLVAASHVLNMEECVNGIRSSVICPGEVATPILANRPVPVSQQERDRMLQAEDVGDLILYVATRPKHVCLNEVLISPTWNRSYIHQAASDPDPQDGSGGQA
jgi:NADP-dependent 3-hydroxy acid dehydrogenase YdfG